MYIMKILNIFILITIFIISHGQTSEDISEDIIEPNFLKIFSKDDFPKNSSEEESNFKKALEESLINDLTLSFQTQSHLDIIKINQESQTDITLSDIEELISIKTSLYQSANKKREQDNVAKEQKENDEDMIVSQDLRKFEEQGSNLRKVNPYIRIYDKTGEISFSENGILLENIRFRVRLGKKDFSENGRDTDFILNYSAIYNKFYLKHTDGSISGNLILLPGDNDKNIPSNITSFVTVYPTFMYRDGKPNDHQAMMGFPLEIPLGEQKEIKTLDLIIYKIFIDTKLDFKSLGFEAEVMINKNSISKKPMESSYRLRYNSINS